MRVEYDRGIKTTTNTIEWQRIQYRIIIRTQFDKRSHQLDSMAHEQRRHRMKHAGTRKKTKKMWKKYGKLVRTIEIDGEKSAKDWDKNWKKSCHESWLLLTIDLFKLIACLFCTTCS